MPCLLEDTKAPRDWGMCPWTRSMNVNSSVMCHFLGKLTYLLLWSIFPAFSEIKLFYRGKESEKDMVEYLMVPGTLYASSHVMSASPWGTCFPLIFTDEETEAQKGLGTCSRSHSKMRSWHVNVLNLDTIQLCQDTGTSSDESQSQPGMFAVVLLMTLNVPL